MEIYDEPVTFRLTSNGARVPALATGLVAIGALAFWGLAAWAAVRSTERQPAVEGGRGASLAFAVVATSFAYLFSQYVWRARSTLFVALRHPGTATIDADILRIEAPGVVSRPLELHRSWVERVELIDGYDLSMTSFTSGYVKRVCAVRLRQPIGVPQGLSPPRLRTGHQLVRLPIPWEPVNAIALAFEDWTAVAAIKRWAGQVAQTEPGDPLAVGPKDHTLRNRQIAAWIICIIGLAIFRFALGNW